MTYFWPILSISVITFIVAIIQYGFAKPKNYIENRYVLLAFGAVMLGVVNYFIVDKPRSFCMLLIAGEWCGITIYQIRFLPRPHWKKPAISEHDMAYRNSAHGFGKKRRAPGNE